MERTPPSGTTPIAAGSDSSSQVTGRDDAASEYFDASSTIELQPPTQPHGTGNRGDQAATQLDSPRLIARQDARSNLFENP